MAAVLCSIQQLVSYGVCKSCDKHRYDTEKEVLDYCKDIPRYRRPRKVFFGEIPRSPTGKIEKPKLRKKYIGREAALNPDI